MFLFVWGGNDTFVTKRSGMRGAWGGVDVRSESVRSESIAVAGGEQLCRPCVDSVIRVTPSFSDNRFI